jgi:DNA-binding XRE family transcriptional regulator
MTHRAKAKPQEFVPAAIADRLIAREHPLKVWREFRGFTQQQLAERARISKPYLSQIENRAREPSVSVLKRLAAALKLDVEDLI